ncbi:MAG: hypothetical protein A2Z31_02560 [candidate division NC10 bacterium RBG_16_65_8]|nr:MAG: hypothetical protein A2Z31_02560 [candidate division NC10 bacterium RBG_16_65_8]
MAATAFQRRLCRLIAKSRRDSGESYVAGGVALNTLLQAPRISRDIDLFHDTDDALRTTWKNDRALLARDGYDLEMIREAPAYVEALVSKGTDRVIVQWLRESAFRFFPLVEDEEFGLVLHPFDLATNKVLALAGRLEPRDWIDVHTTHDKLQPLGYLVWAACGKDPGFGPSSLLAEAGRSGRYSQVELNELAFEGSAPDARDLGAKWHRMLSEAQTIVEALPSHESGNAVLDLQGLPYRQGPERLTADLQEHAVVFHEGRIGGVWPMFSDDSPRHSG